MDGFVCDRCGTVFRYVTAEIRFPSSFDDYGFTYHLCKACKRDLKCWIKEGRELARRARK